MLLSAARCSRSSLAPACAARASLAPAGVSVALARRLATAAKAKKVWGLPAVPDSSRLPQGCMVGSVVSTSMQKTVAVNVTRTRVIPKYMKRRKYSRKFLAHDEEEACGLGDVVRISPCRPLSRRKNFMVQEILKKGDGL